MKSHYEVAIIGGGIIGTALQYYLCKEKITDSIILEQGEIGSGLSKTPPRAMLTPPYQNYPYDLSAAQYQNCISAYQAERIAGKNFFYYQDNDAQKDISGLFFCNKDQATIKW